MLWRRGHCTVCFNYSPNFVYSDHLNIHQCCSKWSVSDKLFLSSQWKKCNICCAFQMCKQKRYFSKDYFRDHSEKVLWCTKQLYYTILLWVILGYESNQAALSFIAQYEWSLLNGKWFTFGLLCYNESMFIERHCS